MVVRLSLTVSNFTYNSYLTNYNGNRSEYIEEHFLIGIMNSTGETETLKKRCSDLQTKVRNLEVINSKLNSKLSELATKTAKRRILDKVDQKTKALKLAGLLHEVQ